MTPDLSEFSYGFAVTHELIHSSAVPLRTAPVFPSLIEEGRAGGGYDVHLDIPGFPLFLQFKRSECMVRRSAVEIRRGLPLRTPFYRMCLTESKRSAQHKLLLALDDRSNQVFYAAPLFHQIREFNDAYLVNQVVDRSVFIRPRDIGRLDNQRHHVAFDVLHSYVLSDPRDTHAIRGQEFWPTLEQRLSKDDRPLRGGPLQDALEIATEALRRNRIREWERDFGRPDKTEEERVLMRLCDLAFRYFGAQLFIVQPAHR